MKGVIVRFVNKRGRDFKSYPMQFNDEANLLTVLLAIMNDARADGAVRLVIQSSWCANFDIAL